MALADDLKAAVDGSEVWTPTPVAAPRGPARGPAFNKFEPKLPRAARFARRLAPPDVTVHVICDGVHHPWTLRDGVKVCPDCAAKWIP